MPSRWLAIGLMAGVLSAALVRASSQAPAPDTQPQPIFRVGVDAVRIDAVVTDKDGHVVSDLTADDFELRQDKKVQKITLARFVPVETPVDTPAPAATRKPRDNGPEPPRPSPAPLAKSNVQRSIALVVDDLGLSAESFEYTRQGLHKFIDTQLQPHDLVAVVRTSSLGGSLQPFTSDRRLMHAVVHGMRWNGNSRSGVEAFEAMQDSYLDAGLPASGGAEAQSLQDFSEINQFRGSLSTAGGTLGALNLLVRSAKDLPGRKAIVLLSEGFKLMMTDRGAYMPDARVRMALDRLIEAALRNGVVIYSVDARGLQTGRPMASDSSSGGGVDADSIGRLRSLLDTQEGLMYVAEQTGGFAALNTNDISAGIGRVVRDIRSYYILGYTPNEDTFAKPGKTPRLHKISLTVKRPGLTVRTRKTFLGVSDPPVRPKVASPSEELRDAAVSPFVTSEIPLRVTTLPGYTPGGGPFVRALLEVDAHALSFAKADDGRITADVDVVGMAFNQDGIEVGHMSTAFTVALKADASPETLNDGEGLVYVLKVPIPRPGAYQIRFAARDRRTGAIGSAGQFAWIDDVADGAFALSGILIGSDASAAGSGKPAEALDTSALLKQQARRVFKAGTRLSYVYEIYNASAPVEAAASVWRGQEKVFAAAADTLVPPASADRRFAAAGGLKLGASLPPGQYVLQVAARTPEANGKKKNTAAVQRVDFEVR